MAIYMPRLFVSEACSWIVGLSNGMFFVRSDPTLTFVKRVKDFNLLRDD